MTDKTAGVGPVERTVRPVAEVCNGILRWHIDGPGFAVETRFLTGLHLLYDQSLLAAARAVGIQQEQTIMDQEREIARLRSTLDCRTCRHHTTATGGCVSVLACREGSAYQRAGVRQCWNEA